MNLDRQNIPAFFGIDYLDSNTTSVSEVKDKLDKLEKSAKEKGFSNITVCFNLCPDEDDNRDYVEVRLRGQRLETEDEWFERIEQVKQANERTLRNAKEVLQKEDVYLKRIQECGAALEKKYA